MANELRNPFFNNDPIDDFFGDFGRNMFNSFNGNSMRTDVVENDDNYQVTAELPGFKKDNIHLDYRDNTLRVFASHDTNNENKDKKGNVLRKERSSSNVERAFHIPDIDFNKINASYDGGLLKVTLPKLANQDNDGHNINIQ